MPDRRTRVHDRRRSYYVRRPQATPYTRPGIWPTVSAMLLDMALGLLVWVLILTAVYFLWLRA